ncbi:hypothetical protein F2Q69_00062092 [Brassica cretica]|uniref:Uncharacterized protein n=1 Tax=Brassica cretica TaxID=69181 RepID=A0A8S9RPK5_BRACR|nr:hypothetical protein F2Q69_00062092 [Brassica cretica]
MASRASVKPETLFTGYGNYGRGNIVRGGGGKAKPETCDPEEVKKAGNDLYKKGNFSEALSLYDKAISMSPENPSYRSNRAAALAASYVRAHQRLASLYLRLGEAENARRHLCFSGQCPDQAELQRVQRLEKHLRLCSEARKIGDWKKVITEVDAAVASGADSSPQARQINACYKGFRFLSIHHSETGCNQCCRSSFSWKRTFHLREILRNECGLREGLRFDAFNSVLYCNRAACWFKLGIRDQSVDGCNQAVRIQPGYTKALLRRAASCGKLGRWDDAVRDYEVLRKELPVDSEVDESLQRALLNKSEEHKYLGYNNQVEESSSVASVAGSRSSRLSISLIYAEVEEALAEAAEIAMISIWLVVAANYPDSGRAYMLERQEFWIVTVFAHIGNNTGINIDR